MNTSIDHIKKYLYQKVHITIDRPLWSTHPKYSFTYPVNYGFVPRTRSGDGKEIDAYILWVFTPMSQFDGVCIAVIHRLNDDDPKLIITPDGIEMSDTQIIASTNFQEKYFDIEIIRG